jgi:hypothetical protein
MTYPFRVTLSNATHTRDITPSVLSLRWRIGMNRPYDSVAAPSSGEIVLDNRSRAASPELDAQHLFAPGAAVTIECQYDGWQTLFAGYIAHAAPDMGDRGPRRTVITLEGPEAALSRVPVALPVMANPRAGELVEAVLDMPPLDAIPRDLDSGSSVFAYAGDRWDGLSADSAIRQTADAERGRFYTARDGTLTFRGRHAGLSDVSPHAAFDAHADEARMVYGGALVNHVSIGLRPRALGTPASVLWTLAGPQRLRPGAQLRLIVPLRDSAGRRIGAVDAVTPVPYTDYTASTSPDGAGSDTTAAVSIDVIALEGSAARLRLNNTGANTVYLMAGAQLRGTPLLGGQPARVEASDAVSIAAYGLLPLDLRLPLLDSVDSAASLAAWELERRAQPSGAVTMLTLGQRTRYADALALSLFDRVRVIDAQTGHDRVYAIVGESHIVTAGGTRHSVVWTLEPAPAAAYWTVGVSPLGTATRIAV